jgi:CHAP domain-containing protein
MTDTSPDRILDMAAGEVGYHEGRSGGHWDNHEKYAPAVPGLEWAQDQAWCATFVSWLALEAGVPDLYPRTASCLAGVKWFKDRHQWSDYPAIGAQVFYGVGGGAHTGIVVSYDDIYIHTVEGNTNDDGGAEGDGVYCKTRVRRDDYVYGYGYPAFSVGIVSADPAWKDKAPKPVTAPPPVKPSKPPTSKPAAKPVVDLSNLVAAARRDPHLRQGGTTHPADVRPVEAALRAEGLLSATYAADGSFGSSTVAAYRNWQIRCGYHGSAADGIPGLASLRKLAAKHGFTVKA